MRYPEEALDFGIRHVVECFKNIPSNVTSVVHLCCGYPEHLDQNDYAKADKSHYGSVMRLLDESGIDQISIENAESENDLASLLPGIKRASVILGSIAVARSAVDDSDVIMSRAKTALKLLDNDETRLWLAPDCGLGFLPVDIALKKLANMVDVAKSL